MLIDTLGVPIYWNIMIHHDIVRFDTYHDADGAHRYISWCGWGTSIHIMMRGRSIDTYHDAGGDTSIHIMMLVVLCIDTYRYFISWYFNYGVNVSIHLKYIRRLRYRTYRKIPYGAVLVRFLDCRTRVQEHEERQTEDGWYAVRKRWFSYPR